MNGAPVPLFIFEEHHEAFLVWSLGRAWGILPEGAATLLHVDEHSDMSVPRLRRPFLPPAAGFAEIARFTYDELDIGNFIWASVYQGLISTIAWLRAGHAAPRSRRELFIAGANPEQTEFMTGPRSAIPWDARDVRLTVFETVSPRDDLQPNPPVILDIDLDYFSSLAYPEYENNRIEITRSAYDDFLNNPYHLLRISPGGKVGVERDNGACYLVFNDFPPQKPRISEEVIEQRLADFFGFLDRNAIRPVLIDICRSRHSGYTPREHVDRIQSGLISGLEQRMPLEPRSVQEAMAK